MSTCVFNTQSGGRTVQCGTNSHKSAYLEQGTRRRQFDNDSGRASTRKLTRSIIEILAVNADERGRAIARRTFSSLAAVFPEARRTERTGSCSFVPNS